MNRVRNSAISTAVAIACGLAVTGPAAANLIWIEWGLNQGGNGHLYAMTETAGTWNQAEATAVTNGGHLVTINEQAEQDWLTTTFPFGGGLAPWIGLWQDTADPNYSEPAGGWKWISGENSAYMNWASAWGEPNEAPPPETNEDRAQMHAFAPGFWQDVPAKADYALQPGIIEIPEPATLSLLFFGGIVALKRKRRQHWSAERTLRL